MTVIVEKNVDVPMRDGIKLRADVDRPSAGGRHPVLLQRTPYNKESWPITAMTLDPLRPPPAMPWSSRMYAHAGPPQAGSSARIATNRSGRSAGRLLTPGALEQYTIDLWATSIVVRAGHRLRLIVTSSDFPRYDRNPNTGELAHKASRLERALQRVFHERARASRVILPLVPHP